MEPAGLSLEALAPVGVPEVEVEVTAPWAFFTVVVTVPSALVVTVVVLPLLLPPPPEAFAPEVPLAPVAAPVDDAADVEASVAMVERVGAEAPPMAPILLTLLPHSIIERWSQPPLPNLTRG